MFLPKRSFGTFLLTLLVIKVIVVQILGYLEQYAHPEMKKSRPRIPPNVADQIRLWEEERNRFTLAEGVLFSDFKNPGEFRSV